MADKKLGFSRTKIWFVFVVLFVCGLMTGVCIINWKNNVAQNKFANNSQNIWGQESCAALENVLVNSLANKDRDCPLVRNDVEILEKLVKYGCDENRSDYQRALENKQAILDVVCDGYFTVYDSVYDDVVEKPCVTIEKNLQEKLGDNHPLINAERRIERAKIYAIMAERGCPENSAEYIDAAKRELEIARGISDDKFDNQETIEVVETYKRLQMQSAAEEIFDKAKKLTNPAIDFIMQVEKVINE